LDIAERSALPFPVIQDACNVLCESGLLSAAQEDRIASEQSTRGNSAKVTSCR
jgi:hypothetical protein